MKKELSSVLKLIGVFTFIAGIANLFIVFTDRGLLIAGVCAYFFGYLIEDEYECIEPVKPKAGTFKEKMEAALKEQQNELNLKNKEL